MAAKSSTVAKRKPNRRKRITKAAARVLTFGEKMVGLTFNPSGDPNVDEIKRLYAKIIDNLVSEAILVKGVQPLRHQFLQGAIERAVDGQMWAVKGWTFNG